MAEAFLEAYRQAFPDDTVETLDLYTAALPAFDGLAVQAKYRILHGEEATAEEKAAWRDVEQFIGQFTAADKYVLAVPMWNFGIPYRLKQYIDILVQPGYTFSFSPEEGYQGLMTGKPTLITYARGGEYPFDSPMDFQKRYLETILGFIGITDLYCVGVEPTLAGGAETAQTKFDAAVEQARQLAPQFTSHPAPIPT